MIRSVQEVPLMQRIPADDLCPVCGSLMGLGSLDTAIENIKKLERETTTMGSRGFEGTPPVYLIFYCVKRLLILVLKSSQIGIAATLFNRS